MNLQQTFEQGLHQSGGGPTVVAVAESPRELTCDIAQADSLAVSFNGLQLATNELASADATKLERIGKALAQRLNYLIEPVAPIEIDATACVVQLRSSPPQRDDDGRSYYELIVRRGGQISLSRFRKENGNS